MAGIFAFPPNRETLGGTAYFIVENTGNILIDSPPWDTEIHQFLKSHGGVKWWVFTHRDALTANIAQIQELLNCSLLVQEQEAYLLPNLPVTAFSEEFSLSLTTSAVWTPGYSPGSSCIYHQSHGGILFTGRHLLPTGPDGVAPLRRPKTFHWLRQLRSVEKLRQRFSADTLYYIAPAANLGALQGDTLVPNASHKLESLDLQALQQTDAIL
ncbi:hypothetical protein PN462_17540 [Spirulina sp. CS-785/01]|nr:hypothetical protein [Spirulina sp. CS-785/01]